MGIAFDPATETTGTGGLAKVKVSLGNWPSGTAISMILVMLVTIELRLCARASGRPDPSLRCDLGLEPVDQIGQFRSAGPAGNARP